MPVPKFFKAEFDSLATHNAIGHPNGEPAYGYLRVSSAGAGGRKVVQVCQDRS